MARPNTLIAETAGAQTPTLKLFGSLLQEHEALGQRLAVALEQSQTEMKKLEAEAKTCAHEMERTKRVADEAGEQKLRARLDAIRKACDEPDDAVAALGVAEPAVEDAGVKDADADVLSAALGMSASEVDALDALAAQEGAADRNEILRLIVLRELAAAGLLPASEPATNPMADHTRQGEQPIRG